jgi:aspartate aminotransferase
LLSDENLDHEYLPIMGLPDFTAAAARLILGHSSAAIQDERVVSVQTISGTGANHLGALFLSRFYTWDGPSKVWLSKPTWGECHVASSALFDWSLHSIYEANHFQIFNNVGIEPVEYAYYDPMTIGLDYPGFLDALKTAPERSVFLLHACAHNPTGVDPTQEQWKAIVDMMLEKKHYTFFDCAYQGFATGNLDQDAWAVRYFIERGVPLLVCQVRADWILLPSSD